jgi:DnaJ-class molecular chaperone
VPALPPDFDQLFGDLFRQFGQKLNKGADLRIALALSGSEAAMGCKREIRVSRRTACAACGGRGARADRPCPRCEHGLVAAEETLTVTVPGGLAPGSVLRLPGKGDAPAGLPPGDLYVALSTPEERAPGELGPAHPFRSAPRPRVEAPVAASPPIRATTLGLVLVLLGILVGFMLFSLK